jgi:hypothetical protein
MSAITDSSDRESVFILREKNIREHVIIRRASINSSPESASVMAVFYPKASSGSIKTVKNLRDFIFFL